GQQINPQLFTGQLSGVNAFAVSQAAALQSLGAGLTVGALGGGVIPGVNAAAFTTPQAAFANAVNFSSLNRTAQNAAAALVAQQQQQQQVQQQQKGQRAFIGTVTKLQEQYGFVDDDVFFKTDVIRGTMPRVGEKVMVEAAYNPSMPFKWNAFRVQLLPNQEVQSGSVYQSQQKQQDVSAGLKQQRASLVSGSRSNRWSDRYDGAQDVDVPSYQQHQHSPYSRRGVERSSPPPPSRRRRGASPYTVQSSRRSPPSYARRRSPSPVRPPGTSSHYSQSSKSYDKGVGHYSSSSFKREREYSPRKSSPTRSSTARSRSRSRSPPRRKARTSLRYAPYIPKFLLGVSELSIFEMRKRYDNLHIASDFFQVKFDWPESVCKASGFSFERQISFHITHKDVDDIQPTPEAVIDPPDANSKYSAKQDKDYFGSRCFAMSIASIAEQKLSTIRVMLISLPNVQDLYRKVIGFADGKFKDEFDPINAQRMIQFLVGSRGKSEIMAIGGSWSPSLDGADPENDPSVLIRTAIRTSKALSGVDLSGCSQCVYPTLLKFLEIRYRRSKDDSGNQSTSNSFGDFETVTIFLPDVWNLCPNESEFSNLQTLLKNQLESKFAVLDGNVSAPVVLQQQQSPSLAENMIVAEQKLDLQLDDAKQKSEELELETNKSGDSKPMHWSRLDVKAMKSEMMTLSFQSEKLYDSQRSENFKRKKKFMKIDPKISVVELKQELEARKADSKGVKAQLASKLSQLLKEEQEAEDKQVQLTDSVETGTEKAVQPIAVESNDSENAAENDTKMKSSDNSRLAETKLETAIVDEREVKRKKEREDREKKERKKDLERHYNLSSYSSPGIFVFPHKSYKGGKFDCKLVSLHALLDYRAEDNKECVFETALFAEAFHEMMLRNGAYNIFKILTHFSKQENRTKTESSDSRQEVQEDQSKGSPEINQNGDFSSQEKASSPKDSHKTKVDKETKETKIVVDPELAFSLACLDSTRCGYFADRDIEDILYALGLCLTKSQIQKLLKSLPNRDTLHYKKLGILLKDIEGEQVQYSGSQSILAQSQEIFTATNNDNNETPRVLTFRGKIIDLDKTLRQIERMEREKCILEQRNAALDKEIKSSKEQIESTDRKRRRLEEDFRDCKKRLYDAEKCLKIRKIKFRIREVDFCTMNVTSIQLKTALQRCKEMGEQMGRLVDKVLPHRGDSSSEKTPKCFASKQDLNKEEKVENSPNETCASQEKPEENADVNEEKSLANEQKDVENDTDAIVDLPSTELLAMKDIEMTEEKSSLQKSDVMEENPEDAPINC
uniref:DBC1/CARP1 catalytically inactive NUDIX hydrolase domain-containing protein n=1 Tax=Romanomermis culicivorax TaxID=13658 RepID=A0A915JT59_ROMCU